MTKRNPETRGTSGCAPLDEMSKSSTMKRFEKKRITKFASEEVTKNLGRFPTPRAPMVMLYRSRAKRMWPFASFSGCCLCRRNCCVVVFDVVVVVKVRVVILSCLYSWWS